MRFMVMVKSNPEIESGRLTSSEELATMGKFNEELIDAGIMLAGEGLQASSNGVRINFGKGKTSVVDGPFAEAKELVAGFWIIQVKDMDEAVAWMRRAPMNEGDQLEIRRVFEVSDFPADSVSEETLRREQEWREQYSKPLTKN